MNRLLIVDGLNLHFQMFFGMPARILNADGKAIQGVWGFVGALIRIIQFINPTHLLVLFDGEHPLDRAGLLKEYKANRTDYSQASDEENPFSQLGEVYAALDFMNIRHTEVTVVCDTAYIVNRYGILPCQYTDFKSLTGDTADNIKGADKVGAVTASVLIRQFGCLQEVISDADKIKKPSVRDSIIRNTDRLRKNYQLIKLEDRASLPYSLDKLAYTYTGYSTHEVLKGIGLK